MTAFPEFKTWGKTPRFFSEIVITEKIDGTNSQVCVTEDGDVFAGSRTRWLTPQDDNYGFAKWVEGNKTELLELGPGYHYGEWWGQGIQRGYGLKEKRFSLFNTERWFTKRPSCCHVVPVIDVRTDARVNNDPFTVEEALEHLRINGSLAAPGYMRPEGIIIFWKKSQKLMKAFLKGSIR